MKTYRHSLDRLCENNIDLIKRGIAMAPKPKIDTYGLELQLEILELVLGAKKDINRNKR